MADYANNNVGMDWGDTLETDGQEFIILPEGDYDFTVTHFERGHFPGSAKMGPSNKATVTLQVQTEDGIANVRTDFILNRLVEWRISAFFRCIGMKRQGERLAMDWNHIEGCHGRAHFRPRSYTDRDGNVRQVNDVSRFYDFDENNVSLETKWTTATNDDDDLPF